MSMVWDDAKPEWRESTAGWFTVPNPDHPDFNIYSGPDRDTAESLCAWLADRAARREGRLL